ncbi:MAG TPA: HlyD family secretion protein [Bacteroidales bacterium]|nr:HlyD family secretion protein [Bacteroidales bacterium]
MKNKTEKQGRKKGLKFYIPMILVIATVVILSVLWYSKYSSYISTDDAFIESDKVTVSSQMMGQITSLYAKEGDTVKQGQLLIELDSSDLVARKRQAETQLAQAKSSKLQAQAKFNYEKESIRVVEIEYERVSEDFDRAKKQYEGNVITREQFDHSRKALETAKARLDASRSQLKVAGTMIESAVAAMVSARAQIAVLDSQLEKTRIVAPAAGIIARRWMLPGETTQPGQAIYTISENQDLWVMVYLEETKLKNVSIGQEVKFSVDAYPGTDFSGRVFYIGSNTASQFSLIPANNASGNFTKVTQRVPVKVSIDSIGTRENKQPADLLAGMSVEIKIIKR